ncbi:MAG: hypothetical protein ACRD16_10620 [Thermoanaerobaculia bacterium]
MKKRASFRLAALLLPVFLLPAPSRAAGKAPGSVLPEVFPREKEVRMALSAAPEHLRDRAGVYALEKDGFVKVRDSQNGFTCIVNRDHPLNLKPTCYDAEGTATILPKVLFVGELLMKGTPLPEISAEVRRGFESGRFQSPRRPGVAYMLSGEIRNFNPSTGKTGSFPPHVMFYAPNLTDEDIGSKGDGEGGLPFIAYQGPQGYMIMIPADAGKTAPKNDAARIEVGDPGLTGARLEPYTNVWKFTQQKPGGPAVDAGTWSDALEATTFEGRPAMKRTQVAKYNKNGIVLTFVDVFDPATMEPRTFDYSRSSDGNTRHIAFRGETVTYRHADTKDAKPEEATARLDRKVFNFYGLYGVLVSTLPLREGFAAEIPAFDTEKMAIDWVPVRVVGRETVAAGAGKTADAWVVETATKLYGKMTWWVTKEPPYVIKAILEIPKNEEGSREIAAIVTYTMV